MKVFNEKQNVGTTKYAVNYHDGVSTHKDGSQFFGIALFKNKRKKEKFLAWLRQEGYTEEQFKLPC